MNRRVEGNLPAELTSFVGRRDDLRRAKGYLSSARLLTLTGPGGVGKSRLARQLARETGRAFPDGVWLVELAGLRQSTLIAQSFAHALGLPEASIDPVEQLVDHLRDKELLLIIDNCEHLADSCAILVGKMLAVAPGLRVVATSRHVLGVEGEQIIPVQELDHDSWHGERTEAMELFEERAAAAYPEFQITDDNRRPVVAICERLEGMPLALELAAARIRAFTPEELLKRLDGATLLRSEEHTRPARHRTLEAAIEWSFQLCSPAEREIWEQLSAFLGGFTMEAMEAVCHIDSGGDDSLLAVLSGLIDKSVVTRVHGTHGKQARFRMLETVRQFGSQRLKKSGKEQSVRRRHRDYYRKLVERARTEYCSERDVAWFAEARREHANLREMLEFSISEEGEGTVALEMASGLRPFWIHCGLILEGYRWLRRALKIEETSTRSRADALATASRLGLILADIEGARTLLAEYRDICRKQHAEAFGAEALLSLSFLAFSDGDIQAATSAAQDAAERGIETNEIGLAADGLAVASILTFITEHPQAEEISNRFMRFAEEHGSHLFKALALWIVGMNRWRRSDISSATSSMRDAIDLFGLFGQPGPVAPCIEGLAWCAASAEDLERAAKLFGAAKSMWKYSQLRIAATMIEHVGASIEKSVQNRLGDENFTRAVQVGKQYSFDQAVSYALGAKAERRSELERAEEPTSLTRRESEIANLVAQGLTNKEIANKLVISHRTADTHVEHILTKLGFRTRTQIATWLRQRGR